MESARSSTRAEQTHILAAMIQLFQVGLDVLYAVDYTGAISNFNKSQFWTSTQWINCENRDVMEGIVFMKQKYKEEGMSFKCFHNRGHPEQWSPRRSHPDDFTALERVAVLSDEIAERVGMFVKEPQAAIYSRAEKMGSLVQRRRDCQTAETTNEDVGQNTTQGNLLRRKPWRWSRSGSCRSIMGCVSKLQAIQQGPYWIQLRGESAQLSLAYDQSRLGQEENRG
jgi:hypothetical protein